MGLAVSGEPNRFLTLTVNPAFLDSPEARLTALNHAWKVIVKRLRRIHRRRTIEYLAVVEGTKAGEPHLHILLRAPFLPHDQLSEWMAELTTAPVVDIRSIRSRRQIANYVAKYIAKKPEQFGTHKRYWTSRGYDQSEPYARDEAEQELESWHVWTHGRRFLRLFWQAQGFALYKANEDRDYAIHLTTSKGALPTWPT